MFTRKYTNDMMGEKFNLLINDARAQDRLYAMENLNGADFREYKDAIKFERDSEPILRKHYPAQPKEELIKMVLPIAEKYSPGIIYKLADLPGHERWGITNKIVLMTKEHEARQAGNGANQNPESETPQPGQGTSPPQPAQGPPQSEQKTLPPQSVLGTLDALIDDPGQSIPLTAGSDPDAYEPISNNHLPDNSPPHKPESLPQNVISSLLSEPIDIEEVLGPYMYQDKPGFFGVDPEKYYRELDPWFPYSEIVGTLTPGCGLLGTYGSGKDKEGRTSVKVFGRDGKPTHFQAGIVQEGDNIEPVTGRRWYGWKPISKSQLHRYPIVWDAYDNFNNRQF